MSFLHFPRTALFSSALSDTQIADDLNMLLASAKCLSDRIHRGEPIWFTQQENEAIKRYIPDSSIGDESNPLFCTFYIGIAAGIAYSFIEKKKPVIRHRDLPRKTRQVDVDDEDT